MAYKNLRNRNILVFCMILIVAFIIFYGIQSKKDRNLNSRYTIGIPTRERIEHFERTYEYTFFVNGIKFEGRTGYSKLKIKDAIGKKFFVKFERDNPSNSEILYNYPVLDTNIFIPKEGLTLLP